MITGHVLGPTAKGFLIQGDDGRRYSALGDSLPANARVLFNRVAHTGRGKREAKDVRLLDELDDQSQLARLPWLQPIDVRRKQQPARA